MPRPVAVLLSGSCLEKLPDLQFCIDNVDKVLIGAGGALLDTVLRARGVNVAEAEEDCVEQIAAVLEEAEANEVEVILPQSIVVRNDEGEEIEVEPTAIPAGFRSVDIGATAAEAFWAHCQECRAVVWADPPGKYPEFPTGTSRMGELLCQHQGMTILGPGATIAMKGLGNHGPWSVLSLPPGFEDQGLSGDWGSASDALPEACEALELPPGLDGAGETSSPARRPRRATIATFADPGKASDKERTLVDRLAAHGIV